MFCVDERGQKFSEVYRLLEHIFLMITMNYFETLSKIRFVETT